MAEAHNDSIVLMADALLEDKLGIPSEDLMTTAELITDMFDTIKPESKEEKEQRPEDPLHLLHRHSYCDGVKQRGAARKTNLCDIITSVQKLEKHKVLQTTMCSSSCGQPAYWQTQCEHRSLFCLVCVLPRGRKCPAEGCGWTDGYGKLLV